MARRRNPLRENRQILHGRPLPCRHLRLDQERLQAITGPNPPKQSDRTHEKPASMLDISPTIAVAVFVSAFALDYLYARYTYYIISMKAEMAATLAFVWHMLSASVIVQYAENSSYILFHVLRRVLGNLSDRLAAAAGGKGCGFAGAGRRGKGHMVLIGASIDALID